jgi:hypothetical protein
MAILKVKTQVREDLRSQVGNKKYHDDQAVEDVLNYILREDKVQDGYMGGFAVNPALAADQFEMVAEAYGKNYGVRLRHMILSFSPEEKIDAYDAKNIAYQVASYYGNEYQIVWACHTDARCLNVHMVMNTVSYQTGMKYSGNKDDYYRFEKHINAVLQPYETYVEMKSDKAD